MKVSLERHDGDCKMCLMFLHYISDEKIKTTRDQVYSTVYYNIPVSNFVLLNSSSFKVIAVEQSLPPEHSLLTVGGTEYSRQTLEFLDAIGHPSNW